MYGVVLMMALSGGADQPAWNEFAGEHVARYGDHGQKQYRCGGCYGGCYGGYGYGSWGYGGTSYAGGYYGYSPYSGASYAGYAQFGAPTYSGLLASDYGYGVPTGQGDRRYYDESILDRERLGAPSAAGDAPATIVVRLPADATLMIDGAPTSSTQGVRRFVSPPLQPGKDYQYTLKAEVTRDGKKVEKTREVTVRAGQPSEVTFDLPADGGSPQK